VRLRPIHFVPDVDAALRFYEALGLEAAARARTGHWIELTASGGELGLHDGAIADDGAGRTGIALNLVADEPLEAVERRLRSAGFPPDGAIVDQEWGRCLFVRAPDGTVVQIDEPDRELYT
jgi:catechol 2,3-dioxygenase-like lactoylglutathione lyase family enzyme